MRRAGLLRAAMVVLAGSLAGVLAGCAREHNPALALACQTQPCTCLPADASYLATAEPAPVQWRANGDAYCDDGFILRLAKQKKR